MGSSTLPNYRRAHHAYLILAAGLALLLFSCGGGGGTAATAPLTDAPGLAALPWPPPEPARLASAAYDLTGDQFGDKNASSASDGSTLLLVPDGGFAWALYPFTGVSTTETLVSFNVSLATGDTSGPVLFLGIANFAKGAWEWHLSGASGAFLPLAQGADYLSPAHTAYVAVAYTGAETASVNTLAVNTEDAGLLPPANLTGAAGVGQVALSWDAAEGAAGYIIERAATKTFLPKTVLTAEPVADTTFVDTTPLANTLYYYRALSAEGSTQSAAGPSIDIHVPRVDLSMPQNVHQAGAGYSSFRISWDWAGANPAHFEVLVTSEPDAPLGNRYAYAPGFVRSVIIDDLDNPTTLYVRVVALDNADWRGVASDDVAGTTLVPWSWSEPVAIASCDTPVAVCSYPGAIAAAYIGASGLEVAVFDGEAWTTGTAYGGTMTNYVSIACTPTGALCAVAHQGGTDDFVGAVGTLGNWSTARIHGDGSTGMGHAVSGEYCQAAGGDSEFLAWHYDASGAVWRVHATLAENPSWSEESSYALERSAWLYYAYIGDDPSAVMFDGTQLQFGDRAGGWSFTPLLDAALDGLGYGTQIFWRDGQWEGLGLFGPHEEWYYLAGTSAPWSAQQVASSAAYGLNATNATEFNGYPVICTFNPMAGWSYIEQRGGWQPQPMGVPALDGSAHAGLGVINGTLYIVFSDPMDNMLKACYGIPPAS